MAGTVHESKGDGSQTEFNYRNTNYNRSRWKKLEYMEYIGFICMETTY